VASFRQVGTVAALSMLLSGCIGLGGSSEPLDTFELTAPPPPATEGRRSRSQILITEPTALKSLDSERIVIKPTASAIEYLAGSQWADRLPRIVQARMVEAYQLSGRVGGVGRPGEGLAIDYQVIADIRAFEVRLAGDDRAVVELYVRVLNDRNGVVAGARLFSHTAPVIGTGNQAFVTALDKAFVAVSGEVVAWSLGVIR
jgi:cholesterol transport system auxiliary component